MHVVTENFYENLYYPSIVITFNTLLQMMELHLYSAVVCHKFNLFNNAVVWALNKFLDVKLTSNRTRNFVS